MKNTNFEGEVYEAKPKSKGFIKFLSLLLLAGMAVGLFLPAFGSDKVYSSSAAARTYSPSCKTFLPADLILPH